MRSMPWTIASGWFFTFGRLRPSRALPGASISRATQDADLMSDPSRDPNSDPDDPGPGRGAEGFDPMEPADLRRRVKAEPGDWAWWFRLGVRCDVEGYNRQAVQAFRRCLSIAPRNGLARYNLARILVGMDREEEAEVQLEEATRVRPDLRDAWVLLAYLRTDWGRWEEALPALRRAVELRPDGDLFWAIANCLWQMERYDEGNRALEECLRWDPNRVLARELFLSLATGR